MSKQGIFSILLVVFSLLVSFGIDAYQNRSKFKVGDVVERVYKNEFKRVVYYEIIVKVGEEDYLTHTADSDGRIFDYENINSKSWLNRHNKAKKIPTFKEYLL